MSGYTTQEQAAAAWVPKHAYIMHMRESYVVYLWQERLICMSFFQIGGRWHVSVDVDIHREALTEKMK